MFIQLGAHQRDKGEEGAFDYALPVTALYPGEVYQTLDDSIGQALVPRLHACAYEGARSLYVGLWYRFRYRI